MSEMGRLLLMVGIALVVIGVIVILLGRTRLPLGRLPGDVLYRGKNTTFYFPLASSVLISIVLSIVLFLIGRLKG
jgi:heme/copper-type cytochrome/quinol oxidase subunit 2